MMTCSYLCKPQLQIPSIAHSVLVCKSWCPSHAEYQHCPSRTGDWCHPRSCLATCQVTLPCRHYSWPGNMKNKLVLPSNKHVQESTKQKRNTENLESQSASAFLEHRYCKSGSIIHLSFNHTGQQTVADPEQDANSSQRTCMHIPHNQRLQLASMRLDCGKKPAWLRENLQRSI